MAAGSGGTDPPPRRRYARNLRLPNWEGGVAYPSDAVPPCHRLQVVQTLIVVEKEPIIAATTKNARSRRSISLDDETVRVLKEHRKAQTKVHEIAGSLWQDSGLVFTRGDGTPIRPAHVTRFVQAAAADAGVEPIGVHGLGHTWATLALESGVHAKVVQERLGHANIATTLDIYSHVVPEMDQEAATKVANLIDYRQAR